MSIRTNPFRCEPVDHSSRLAERLASEFQDSVSSRDGESLEGITLETATSRVIVKMNVVEQHDKSVTLIVPQIPTMNTILAILGILKKSRCRCYPECLS